MGERDFREIKRRKWKMARKKTKKKSKARVVKKMTQKGKRSDRKKDKKRKALPPGVRISKSGNRYTERRPNRSDVNSKTNL